MGSSSGHGSSSYHSSFKILLIGDTEVGKTYDVTRREKFTNLADVWAKEVDLYSINQDCINVLVGNEVDKGSSSNDLGLKMMLSSVTRRGEGSHVSFIQ